MAGANRARLPALPVSCLWQAVQRAQRWNSEPRSDGRAINEKVRLYARVGAALISAHDDEKDAFGAITAVISWERFRATVAEAQALARPETFDVYQKMGEHYAGIRRWSPTRYQPRNDHTRSVAVPGTSTSSGAISRATNGWPGRSPRIRNAVAHASQCRCHWSLMVVELLSILPSTPVSASGSVAFLAATPNLNLNLGTRARIQQPRPARMTRTTECSALSKSRPRAISDRDAKMKKMNERAANRLQNEGLVRIAHASGEVPPRDRNSPGGRHGDGRLTSGASRRADREGHCVT